MRKHHLIASFVIFVAGFGLSTLIDGRNLVSLAKETRSNSTVPQVIARTAQRPAGSQFWEYRVVSRTTGYKNLEADLNRLAGEGFEVFTVKQTGEGTGVGFNLTILLRRPRYQ